MSRPPVTIEADRFDLSQAHLEGWTIDLDEVLGEYRIFAVEDGPFRSHDAAWAHVHGLAYRIDGYHLAALNWIDHATILHKAGNR